MSGMDATTVARAGHQALMRGAPGCGPRTCEHLGGIIGRVPPATRGDEGQQSLDEPCMV